MMPSLVSVLLICSAVGLVACEPDAAEPERLVGDDWATSFSEVRTCRASPDHDLEHVALWIDPGSKALWERCVDAFPEGDSDCTEVFPAGATFVKPQYFDAACTQLARISVAQKDPAFAASGGWHWQEITFDEGVGTVSQDGAIKRCANCHATCGGYDQRCYMDE